ncbi:MAG: tetratricopeptide repeat protein [Alphaproteobacteria bacterium]|nr:MAG: tetratricopeptide repeat protein [Alphaproteobacteria bacterium]
MTHRISLKLAAGAFALALSLAAMPALAVDSGGGGSDSSSQTSGPTLGDARALIKAQKWKSAITMLKTIVANDSRNADALNLLGFSLRKSGDMKNAEGFYLKALKLNPRHKGANEYLGELYVETGHVDKAKARLETLAKLCGNTTCEEYEDLAKAIAAAT